MGAGAKLPVALCTLPRSPLALSLLLDLPSLSRDSPRGLCRLVEFCEFPRAAVKPHLPPERVLSASVPPAFASEMNVSL